MSFFNPEKFTNEAVEKLKTELSDKAIIAASGGVDSTVAAVLAAKAVKDNLLAVYVDTGYMRLGESEYVSSMLSTLGVKHKVVDASEKFYSVLKGETDPEEKRKIIGELFIRVFEKEAEDYGGKFLVQGTIAPDWIESGGGLRDTIKSHHNVGGLPDYTIGFIYLPGVFGIVIFSFFFAKVGTQLAHKLNDKFLQFIFAAHLVPVAIYWFLK